MDYMMALDVKSVLNAVKKYAVGYCDAQTKIKTKTDSYVVML